MVILVGLAGLIICTASLIFVWRAEASKPTLIHQDSLTGYPELAAETIQIEFLYNGDNYPSALNAAGDFAALLSTETGLTIQATLERCEADVIEDLGTGQVDLATMSSFGYVHGTDLYPGMQAKLVNLRVGQGYYRSQLNVQKKYTDISQLENKRFAMSDPGSTSGQYVPYLMIKNLTGKTPSEYFSETYFAGGHSQVIRDVYNGVTDCGATFQDARNMVAGEYPDVNDVVSVLMVSDPIPNEPWAFRPGFDETQAQKIANDIITVAGTPQGQAALTTIYGFNFEGVETTQDSAYDIAREIVSEFGLELLPCIYTYLPVVTK
jgi:phosphonate transport system substrate-binding protein